MRNAGASAHHLNVACGCTALVAATVLMGDRTAPDIGDDLHIAMWMRVEPGVRLDDVVIDYEKLAKTHFLWVLVAGKAEVMLCVEPSVICATKRFMGVMSEHLSPLPV